jgi:hypothetical protein
MSNKKFIGGGFPGIRECIDEQNNMTKESREKREFSVRKIIPITQILNKCKNQPTTKFNLSEEFNVKSDVKYDNASEELTEYNKFSNNHLKLINGPVSRLSETSEYINSDDDVKSKSKRGSNAKSKRGSNAKSKRGSNAKSKRGSNAKSKRGSNAKSKRGSNNT